MNCARTFDLPTTGVEHTMTWLTSSTGGSRRGKSVASRFQSLASARPHEASAMQAPASGQVMDTLFRAASRNQVRELAASRMQVQLARLPQVHGKCIT